LSAWGAAYYGEWLTLSIIPSVLAFADFGFGTAASNSFVLNYCANKKNEAADVYHTGLVVVTGSVLLGILLSFLVMFIAWKSGLLSKSLIKPSDAIWAVSFLMASRLVSFYNQTFEAFYRAVHRAATATNLLTIEGFLRIAAGIIVLVLGYGIVVYSLWQFIVAILFNIGYALYGRSLIKDLPKGNWKTSIAKDIAKKGAAYMVSPIWQSLYFQGSTIVVRIVIGPEAVAVFNTVRTLCRSVNQIFSIVNGAIFPEMQIAIGEDNYPLARLILKKSLKLVFISAIIGVVLLCTIGPWFYNWWTHNELQVSWGLWILFMIGILFNAIWWTSCTVFRAMNRPYKFAIYSISSAVISVIISYILALPLGLLGATIGYVFLDILMSFLVLPEANRLLNEK